MNILAIETSCDETAISIIEASGGIKKPLFRVRANVVHSQVKLHAQYGGVFPTLAKREHSRNLVPVLMEALAQSFGISNFQFPIPKKFPRFQSAKLENILEREPELLEQFLREIPKIKKPKIDAIAVTYGPGLEPALWVGINFAKALSLVWGVPVVPVNHMEGHLFSSFIRGKKFTISGLQFPILALLISGGHTELVLIKNWMKYKKIGETRDDAVGEAFDKVARMLGLPYPGGPQIAALAVTADKHGPSASPSQKSAFRLPRPMLNSKDYNFSFSGLKTAVLYMVRDIKKLTPSIKASIAREFEEAVTEVLVTKTLRAARDYKTRAIILGGGVAANARIRAELKRKIPLELPDVALYLPDISATTDNALMIAVAGYFRSLKKKPAPCSRIKATGNLTL